MLPMTLHEYHIEHIWLTCDKLLVIGYSSVLLSNVPCQSLNSICCPRSKDEIIGYIYLKTEEIRLSGIRLETSI